MGDAATLLAPDGKPAAGRDFAAGSGEAWPADAATRINQANDVLSSFERRSDYNAALASAQPVTSAAAGTTAASAKVAVSQN